MKSALRAAFAIGILFSLWAFAPSPSRAPAPAQLQPSSAPLLATVQRLYTPLPDGAWLDAEVVLNNNSTTPMTVATTLYRGGVGAAGVPITLQPGEVRWVRLTDLNEPTGREVATNDGVELASFSQLMELGAQIMLVRPHGAGSVDVPFTGAVEYRSAVQEAVWSSQPGARIVVALGNASDVTVVTTIEGSGGPSEEIQLPAHAARTIVWTAPAKSPAAAGWMKINSRGPIGSVRATGFTEVRGRYAGGVRFYDPAVARQSNLFATRVRLSDAVPSLALRNTSDVAVTAIPELQPVDELSGPVDLAAVTIAPHSAVIVNLGSLATETSEISAISRASVRIWNSGPAGSLIGGLSAVSRDGSRAYDIPLRDSGPVGHATGSYPWRIDADYDTLVSITNVSGRGAQYHARIVYPGGVYWLNPDELAPGDTAVFDLRELRDDYVPDMYGNTLPLSLTSGQFRWSVINAKGETQLIGRAEIVSASADRSSSYSCWVCCPDHTAYGLLSPSSLTIPEGDAQNTGVLSHYADCYGNGAGDYGAYANSWWVQYTAVTAMSTLGTGSAQASAISGGNSNVTGFWDGEGYNVDYDNSECIYYVPSLDGPGQVKTQVPTSLGLTYEQYVSPPPSGQLYDKERHYRVLDQDGQSILKNGIHITESYPPESISGTCYLGNPQTGDGYTNSTGEFQDHYRLGVGAPNPCTTTATQHHFADGRQVSTYTVTWTYSGVTIQ